MSSFLFFPRFPSVASPFAPQILRTLRRIQRVFACLARAVVVDGCNPNATLRHRECRNNLARQQLVAQSGVETFHDPVLPRRSWLAIQRVGSAFFASLFHHIRDEFAFIVASNIFWRATYRGQQ